MTVATVVAGQVKPVRTTVEQPRPNATFSLLRQLFVLLPAKCWQLVERGEVGDVVLDVAVSQRVRPPPTGGFSGNVCEFDVGLQLQRSKTVNCSDRVRRAHGFDWLASCLKHPW